MSLVQMTLSGGAFILFIVVVRVLALHRLPKGAFLALWEMAALRLLLQEEETGESAWHGGRQAEREELFKIEQYAEMALYFARLDSLSSDLLFRHCDVQEIVKQAVRKLFGPFFAQRPFFSDGSI